MTRTGPDGADESALDAVAQQWLRQVAAQGFVPRKARARVALRELLQQLVAAARAATREIDLSTTQQMPAVEQVNVAASDIAPGDPGRPK